MNMIAKEKEYLREYNKLAKVKVKTLGDMFLLSFNLYLKKNSKL